MLKAFLQNWRLTLKSEKSDSKDSIALESKQLNEKQAWKITEYTIEKMSKLFL